MTIKNISILLFVLIGSFSNIQNDILGTWENNKTGYIVKIYEQDNQFFGKIVKVKGDNSDDVGHILIKNIVYDVSNKRYFGEVETTKGMTADCEIEFINKDKFQLTVRKLFIKKTQLFSRTE